MRIWLKIIQDHRMSQQAVREFDSPRPAGIPGWHAVLTEAGKELDLACPVLLKKHLYELDRFSRTVFSPSDFMESVPFDRLELEIIDEKSKKPERTLEEQMWKEI